MKITHIHIERFRGFQNEDFEVGSLLTAIAGQNGTQKSTLLGIITQTFTLKTEDSMRVEKPLCGGSYISAFKDKFRLSPTFDKPKGHEWTISFAFRHPGSRESVRNPQWSLAASYCRYILCKIPGIESGDCTKGTHSPPSGFSPPLLL